MKALISVLFGSLVIATFIGIVAYTLLRQPSIDSDATSANGIVETKANQPEVGNKEVEVAPKPTTSPDTEKNSRTVNNIEFFTKDEWKVEKQRQEKAADEKAEEESRLQAEASEEAKQKYLANFDDQGLHLGMVAAIKSRLKDPKSFYVSQNNRVDCEPGLPGTIEMIFHSKNSFGGYERGVATAEIDGWGKLEGNVEID